MTAFTFVEIGVKEYTRSPAAPLATRDVITLSTSVLRKEDVCFLLTHHSLQGLFKSYKQQT